MLSLFFNRKKLLADRALLGSWGEKYCERYLKRKGYQCIARNFSISAGEIDLVMTCRDVLVFVEVKTRSSEEFAKAQEAVNSAKRSRLLAAGRYFMNKYKLSDMAYRFDVVAVVLPEKGRPQVRHYEKAFDG